LLDLFLYDSWTDPYGRDFADRMASIERRIGPAYEAAWAWALAMTERRGKEGSAALRAGSARGTAVRTTASPATEVTGVVCKQLQQSLRHK
jgi:hypothetical protein